MGARCCCLRAKSVCVYGSSLCRRQPRLFTGCSFCAVGVGCVQAEAEQSSVHDEDCSQNTGDVAIVQDKSGSTHSAESLQPLCDDIRIAKDKHDLVECKLDLLGKSSKSDFQLDDEEDVCPTCLEEYDEENPKIITKCEHHFHLACILEWMERSDTCPICDQEMVFNETQ
eukprot:TRINITY_DN1831_c0_g1_i2.p1 TRINITY_DN1831_c0_g1~~TRINITY_DN1831_c0_g1_i2.p1  ORF type:complete len:170 (-),score=33.24 TRINITY_DN1831_c0_g1_i2:471-980(-)